MTQVFPTPKNLAKPGRMGLLAWARVLVELHKQPMMALDVVRMRGIPGRGQRVSEQLWQLQRAGLVHVATWVQQRRASVYTPVFAGGEGVSAPYPVALTKRPVPGSTRTHVPAGVELVAFIELIRALKEGASRLDLNEATGVYHHRIAPVLAMLRAEGFLHTCGWRKTIDHGGKWTEVVKFGPGVNVRKPVPQRRSRIVAKSAKICKARRAHLAMVHMTAGPIAHQAAA